MQIDAATRRNLELAATLSGERRGSLLAAHRPHRDRRRRAAARRAAGGAADRCRGDRGAARHGAVLSSSDAGLREDRARAAAPLPGHRACLDPAQPRPRRAARSRGVARRARRDRRIARGCLRRRASCRCRRRSGRGRARPRRPRACWSSGCRVRSPPNCRYLPATAASSRRAMRRSSTSCANCATRAAARSPPCRRAMPRRPASPRCASATTT